MNILEETSVLYKRDSNGRVRIWKGEVNSQFQWRTITGLQEGKQVQSGWKTVTQKNIGKINETSLEQQAILEMNADFKKKTESGYFNSLTNIDAYDKIKPMLASKHEDAKYNFLKVQYSSQPKLDGIRCIARANGLWTRAGKELVSVPHVNDDLKVFFENNPDVILDGELYNHDLRDNFNKITSLVRKTKPTAEDLEESKELVEYHVYDMITNEPMVFTERYEWINSNVKCDYVKVVETSDVPDLKTMDDLYGSYLQDGFEGQMIRANDVYQQNKRSKFLIKRKEFITEEYKVIGVEEGLGNWSGTVKRFILATEDGVKFGSGVRGTLKVLGDLLNSGVVPTWCTLRYFALTPDGIPRFPVVIDWGVGERND